MTDLKASRATLRPFRIDDAADICRIHLMFCVDNAAHYGNSQLNVVEAGGRMVGLVMWAPAFEPAWFDPGIERWAKLHELHVRMDHHNRGIGTRVV
jgi:hypothetical protein